MADETSSVDAPEIPDETAQVETAGAESLESDDSADKVVLHQAVEIKDVGPCKKHVRVTISRADIDRHFDERFKSLVGDSWLPGFRPGKAPRKLVVSRYKKDVHDQVRADLLFASLAQLAETHTMAPLASPNLNPLDLQVPEQGDFVYEFEVEVRPEFDLPDYKNLKIKRPVIKFTDADIDNARRRLLRRHGQLVPKDGPVERGDTIICDTETRYAGQSLGSSKEIALEVEETLTLKDAIVQNFAEKVVGAKAGDRREVEIIMTDSVRQELLRGKAAQLVLDIKDVKQLREPELDERLLATFGVKTVDQLNEIIRVTLERQAEYQQRQSARQQILQILAGDAKFQLPQDLLVRQARRSLTRRVLEMREAGIDEAEIRARERMLQRDVLASTAESLKEHFVLQKIAEIEKIETGEDEINAEIERIAEQYGDSPRRVRAQMERDDMIETLAGQLIERKALDLVLESAQYEDVEAPRQGEISSAEAQAVEGELRDPTAIPEAPAEGAAEAASASAPDAQ